MNNRQAIYLHEAMMNNPTVRAIISTLNEGGQQPKDAIEMHRKIADALADASRRIQLGEHVKRSFER